MAHMIPYQVKLQLSRDVNTDVKTDSARNARLAHNFDVPMESEEIRLARTLRKRTLELQDIMTALAANYADSDTLQLRPADHTGYRQNRQELLRDTVHVPSARVLVTEYRRSAQEFQEILQALKEEFERQDRLHQEKLAKLNIEPSPVPSPVASPVSSPVASRKPEEFIENDDAQILEVERPSDRATDSEGPRLVPWAQCVADWFNPKPSKQESRSRGCIPSWLPRFACAPPAPVPEVDSVCTEEQDHAVVKAVVQKVVKAVVDNEAACHPQL